MQKSSRLLRIALGGGDMPSTEQYSRAGIGT